MGQGVQARLREEGVVDYVAPSVVLGQRYWWGREELCWILVDEEDSRMRKDTDTGCSTRRSRETVELPGRDMRCWDWVCADGNGYKG